MFPNPVLQQIFSYLPILDRWRLSRVSRRWYAHAYDPYLYQHVEFKDLELKTLLRAMEQIVTIHPHLRSITIDGCYSQFIKNKVVPVQFSTQPPYRPLLYSHIKTLPPRRRRQEYLKHGFDLHNYFSDLFLALLRLDAVHTIKILNCDLDLETTEVFSIIACNAPSLSTFYYINNGDKGFNSSGLLQTLVIATPQMRHFRGYHGGMNDDIVVTMTRHWPLLESLTLSSIKSKEIVELAEITNEEGHAFHGTSPTGNVSNRVFWELLCKCKHLHTLELHDLACVTNRDLAYYTLLLCDHENRANRYRYTPELPGNSIRNLIITKYVTTPLSNPGFHSIVQLFPHLTKLEYATNFHTFNNQLEGVTPDMFEAERLAVAQYMNTQPFIYEGRWHQPITTEQRLMAGMTIGSSHSSS